MKVSEILDAKGHDVFSIDQDSPLTQAVSILSEENIGALVATGTGGTITGILSERDIVRQLGKEGISALNKPVHALMTATPFCCTPDDTVQDIMHQMTSKRIRHMPVMQNDKMVGMISIGDVVKRKIEESEQEAAALRDYIAT